MIFLDIPENNELVHNALTNLYRKTLFLIILAPPLGYLNSRNNLRVLEYSLGKYDIKCKYCSALHFKNEEKAKFTFKNCCSKGKYKISIRESYPEFLKNILVDNKNIFHKNMLDNIRSINSAVGFASFGANIDLIQGGGVQAMKIHGQIYHLTSPLYTNDVNKPMYSQLYVHDAASALRIQKENTANKRINDEFLKRIYERFQSICKEFEDVG